MYYIIERIFYERVDCVGISRGAPLETQKRTSKCYKRRKFLNKYTFLNSPTIVLFTADFSGKHYCKTSSASTQVVYIVTTEL
jgi:hypothetical protein